MLCYYAMLLCYAILCHAMPWYESPCHTNATVKLCHTIVHIPYWYQTIPDQTIDAIRMRPAILDLISGHGAKNSVVSLTGGARIEPNQTEIDHTILYHAILYRTVQYTELHSIILCLTIPRTTPHCAAPDHTTPRHATPCHAALHHTISNHYIPYQYHIITISLPYHYHAMPRYAIPYNGVWY